MSFETMFKSPTAAYRGKPFWAWNGKLDEQELRRQIRILNTMGLAGGFMHSRVGMNTEYLSEEWFQMINACIDEVKKSDGEVWLYDEDRWPSGAAGGLVTKNPEFRLNFMTAHIADDYQVTGNELACYFVKMNGLTVEDITDMVDLSRESCPDGYQTLAFYREQAECTSWYNGYTYLDTMSEKAVQEFIKVTYEPYKKHCGSNFGKTVPGMFTDEPNHGIVCNIPENTDSVKRIQIPWTDELVPKFKDKFTYDILDHLPKIIFDINGETNYKARYDYHLLKTELFVTNFAKQCGDWCGENSLMFTGHVLSEATLSGQTKVIGAAMPFYEHMQAPGIDILTAKSEEYETAKQCTSVANQLGKKWCLSELYGCTGWGFTFEGHKMIGDWQAAMGINLRCQHLSYYTMFQEAKRDYPASIFYQSPWWEEYKTVEDYFSRVNVVTTQGKAVKKLLVIHPIESMWLSLAANYQDNAKVKELDSFLPTIRDYLLENNIEFDYGDESLIAKFANVKSNKFVVGNMTYDAVLVPPMLTMRKSTVDILQQFKDAGGNLTFVTPVATAIEAEASSSVDTLAQGKTIALTEDEIINAVSQTRILSVKDADGNEIRNTRFMFREDNDKCYLFICNVSENHYDDVNIELSRTGSVEEWDPQTGDKNIANFATGGNLEISTTLHRYGSRIFIIDKTSSIKTGLIDSEKAVESIELEMGDCPVTFNDMNTIVFDFPSSYKIDGQEFTDKKEILKIDQQARRTLGVPVRGGSMCQPWTRKKETNLKSIPVELTYQFNCEAFPEATLELAIESPNCYQITLNGQRINQDKESGWWVDLSTKKIPLDANTLKLGKNELKLTLDYNEENGLEAIFLLGNFGVRLENDGTSVMTNAVKTLQAGDWCKQGLPFYSGAVTYSFQADIANLADQATMTIPEFHGTCAKVYVNDIDCGTIGWQPFQYNIANALKAGKNNIKVQVFSSRRNAFGPFHNTDCVEGAKVWVGPGQFIADDEKWTDNYNLFTYGLYKAPVIELSK